MEEHAIVRQNINLTRFRFEVHKHAVGAPMLPTQSDLVRLKGVNRVMSSVSQQLQVSIEKKTFFR